MSDTSRILVLRYLLQLLAGEEALPLGQLREELEAAKLVGLTSGSARAALERTMRNHLKYLRSECERVLGDRCIWIQGTGAEVGFAPGGKGPFYRLRLHDGMPLIDALGEVVDCTEAEALLAAGRLLAVPGGGPFEAALERLRQRVVPDGLPSQVVSASGFDQGTRHEVLHEVLRVLHRNSGQSSRRSRCRRWLRLESAEGGQLVWPVLLHPAWTPPCPGWRLLAWNGGWLDLPLADIDRASAGPMATQHDVGVPDTVDGDAARLHAAAFLGSCPGPLQLAHIRLDRRSGAPARMRWGDAERVERDGDGQVVHCRTSDGAAMRAWIGMMPGARLIGLDPAD